MNIKSSAPMRALKQITSKYGKELWNWGEAVRADENGPAWDKSRVYLPVAAYMAWIKNYFGNNIQALLADDVAKEIGKIPALGAWRAAKTIYDFDPALASELYAQSKTDSIKLSSDSFSLPYWSIYIRSNLPEFWFDNKIDGFFCHLDKDRGNMEIRIIPLMSDGKALPTIFMLLPKEPKDFKEIIKDTSEEYRENAYKDENAPTASDVAASLNESGEHIARWLSLIVYLQAINKEITVDKAVPFKRTRKIKDTQQEVEHLIVGQETGERIRTLRETIRRANNGESKGGHHRSPAPHLRRAHWHTFLTGKGRKKRAVKWLAPIMVSPGAEPQDIVTINKVVR